MRGATSVGLLALILLASCGGGNQASQTQARPALHLVAIGDSLARDTNCAGCNDFVDLYAEALTRATGRAVKVDNLSAFGGAERGGA
jgi:hypothetical protein